MSDTYLQDFGHLRKQAKARDVHDPMSACGRWDDLYLRASKPRLKRVRRQSMRRDLTISLKNGPTFKITSINGEATKMLGFHCEPVTVKYKLDSPSYPSRHRELSQEDRSRAPRMQMRTVGVRHVYDVLEELIRKLRFRAPNERTLLAFRALWEHRHRLKAHADLPRNPKVKTKPQLRPAPAVKASARVTSKRVIPPAALAEFNSIRERLSKMDPESKDRVALLMRQRELHKLIWGQP